MIKSVSWEVIEIVWRKHLWPDRISKIETNSAMSYKTGYDMFNMNTKATFFGYFIKEELVGVNSGHGCTDSSYRSRGLWVFPEHRRKGIGKYLLNATIDQARCENSKMIWSFPKRTSWHTYKSVGFTLKSDWQPSETSTENAYCILELYE
jgi:GNAT superfamily N-acetyltransferase